MATAGLKSLQQLQVSECDNHDLCCSAQLLGQVQLFTTPWRVDLQAPLSVEFSMQYWSEFPFPSPGALPDSEIESASLALAGRFFTTVPPGSRLSLQSWLLEALGFLLPWHWEPHTVPHNYTSLLPTRLCTRCSLCLTGFPLSSFHFPYLENAHSDFMTQFRQLPYPQE